jgi:uncharacterized protein
VIRVTADTNVIVSGLNFRRGKPFELLELARTGKISLTVSEAILDEIEDVLQRKFAWTAEEAVKARNRVTAIARTIKPTVELNVIKEDPPDNRILECAVSSGADYIISGDKDLLRLGRYDSIKILNVADFLETAAQAGRPR